LPSVVTILTTHSPRDWLISTVGGDGLVSAMLLLQKLMVSECLTKSVAPHISVNKYNAIDGWDSPNRAQAGFHRHRDQKHDPPVAAPPKGDRRASRDSRPYTCRTRKRLRRLQPFHVLPIGQTRYTSAHRPP